MKIGQIPGIFISVKADSLEFPSPCFLTYFREFVMGKDVQDMQLGCLWSRDNIMTVSLSGYINYLDRNNPSQPWKILKVKCMLNYARRCIQGIIVLKILSFGEVLQ